VRTFQFHPGNTGHGTPATNKKLINLMISDIFVQAKENIAVIAA
jgi:hypothetical protein